MDAGTLAETLAPHVADGWEHVAEVARPGTAAKVAAVRRGASTASLGAADAVRAVTEAPDPTAAAADETRSTVRAAAGGVARRAPTAVLFEGHPADIAARIAARATATDAMLDAYLDADLAVREVTAAPLLAIANAGAAAAILTERAAALAPVEFTEFIYGIVTDLSRRASQKRPGGSRMPFEQRRELEALQRQIGRLDVATIAALRCWLAQHGGPGCTVDTLGTGLRIPNFDRPSPPEAGAGLAVLATVRAISFTGPAELGRAVVDSYKETSFGRLPIWLIALTRNAARTKVPWSELRAAVAGDAPLGSDEFALPTFFDTMYGAALGEGQLGEAYAIEMLRAELAAPLAVGGHHQDVLDTLPGIAGQLGAEVALRAAAVSSQAASASTRTSDAVLAPFVALFESGSLTNGAIDAAIAGDPLLAAYVTDSIVGLLSRRKKIPRNVWRYTVRLAPSATLAEAATGDVTVAARWAAALSEAVAEHPGVDRGELWAAVCTLAPKLEHCTADTVAIAAATIADS